MAPRSGPGSQRRPLVCHLVAPPTYPPPTYPPSSYPPQPPLASPLQSFHEPKQGWNKLTQQYLADFELYFIRLEEFKREYGDTDVPTRLANYIVPNAPTTRVNATPATMKIVSNSSPTTEEATNENSQGTNATTTPEETTTTEKIINQAKYTCTLGKWVVFVRKQMKIYQICSETSLLTDQQERRLRNLQLCMEPKRGVGRKQAELLPAWNEERFQELQVFHQRRGHVMVPLTPPSPLRDWIDRVLLAYRDRREGVVSTITEEQIQRLDDLGLDWTEKRRYTFDEWAQRWRDYRLQNDGKDPPGKHGRLGPWVLKMKNAYIKYQNKEDNPGITQEQINQLNDWGFKWEKFGRNQNRQPTKRFDERVEELKAYKEQYGDCLVPQLYPDLGNFVSKMRQDFKNWKVPDKKSSMTDERFAKLSEVGFVFDKQKDGPRFKKQKFRGNHHSLGTKRLKQTIEQRTHTNNNNERDANNNERDASDATNTDQVDISNNSSSKDIADSEIEDVKKMRTDFKNWNLPHKKAAMTDERFAILVEVGFAFDKQKDGPRFNKQKFSGNSHSLETKRLEQTIERTHNNERDASDATNTNQAPTTSQIRNLKK